MPISSSFMMPRSEEKEFDLIPDDAYECVIKDVEDKISHFKDDDGNEKMVLNFTFQITEEGKVKNRLVWKEVSPYAFYGSKGPSILLQIFNCVNGVDLTQEQVDAIGTEQVAGLIGRKLRVSVGHTTSKSGKVYNKASGFLPTKLVDPRPTVADVAKDDTDVSSIPF